MWKPNHLIEMSLPTLLRTGFVVPRSGLSKTEKNAIKNTRSIDYITNFISDRVPIVSGSNPKIPAKTIGDKVIVLKSETGSGKSTVIPASLYEKFQSRMNKNIAITQPRVLTAIDTCTDLPNHYAFLKLDQNLGYITGEFKRRPSGKGIIFMTIGILLQQLKILSDEKFMKTYSFILIDEVHDRSINVDMSLFLLKKFLINNYKDPNCPIIILMSATFKPSTFTEYFETPKENLINVVGSTFPIEANFLKYDSCDFITKTINIAERLHVENITDIEENSVSRDILIFVKGAAPMKAILEQLHIFNASVLSKDLDHVLNYISEKKKNDRDEKKGGGHDPVAHYYIAPIELSSTSFYSSGSEYQNLFSDINNITIPVYKLNEKGGLSPDIDYWIKPTRRIIVATNVAETGVTIETLKYCIDTGYVNGLEFNPDFGIMAMFQKNVTKGMAIQRRGRVGRKAPGQWFPIYTEKTFQDLNEDQFADILTTDITESILNIITKETETTLIENESLHITPQLIKENNMFLTNNITNKNYYYYKSVKSLNMSAVDFLETPSASALNFTMEKLHGLAFIDSEFNPTILGMYAFKIRKISMENIRFIFAGYSYGANILDLITIVAFTEVRRRSIFHRKYQPINMFKKKLSDAEYEFYYKIVIGDQMIEYILIWEFLSEFLNETISKMNKKTSSMIFSVNSIKQWCVDNKLVYDGIMQVIAVRDEIIENFISIGINPYYNGLDIEKGTYNLLTMFRTNLDEFINEVRKIKYCIMDGYRFNLCIWNDSSKKYILHHRNIPISVRSDVNTRMGDDAIQTNPNYLILSNIMMMESQKNKGMYEFESIGSVSVMDSYLDMDMNFLKH